MLGHWYIIAGNEWGAVGGGGYDGGCAARGVGAFPWAAAGARATMG